MSAHFLANRPFPTPPDPYSPLSASPRSGWRCHPLPEIWVSGNGSPMQAEAESLPNQSPTSTGSSLSSALDEDLARPRPNARSASPQSYGHVPPPSPGQMRIYQSCQISGPIHEVIYFRWRLRVGIPLSSLLAGTRRIDQCDNLLSSPVGFANLMHISWNGYPSARYCVAVRGRLLRFTVQTLGRSVADNIKHYIAANGISLPLNKIVLVAFGRGSHGNDWVAVVNKIL